MVTIQQVVSNNADQGDQACPLEVVGPSSVAAEQTSLLLSKEDQQSRNNDAEPSSAAAANTPLFPFVTTSRVLNSLNETLRALNDKGENSAAGDEPTIAHPHVELQKRFADGTTRRASADELRAVDAEQQMGQAAQYVQSLPDRQSQLAWCRHQRRAGNELYRRGDYAAAMDVYLTCLVALAPPRSPKEETTTTPDDEDNAPLSEQPPADRPCSSLQQQQQEQDSTLLFLQVMNNLAQAALQLHWYRKAEKFCSIALQEHGEKTSASIAAASFSSNDDQQQQQPQNLQLAKLYYKRGKARRLSGEYPGAGSDLRQALVYLKKTSSEDDDRTAQDCQKAVHREQTLLQRAVAKGEKNRQRTQKAMQQVLGGGGGGSGATSSTRNAEPSAEEVDAVSSQEEDAFSFAPTRGKRQYSKLRAPSAYPPQQQEEVEQQQRAEEDDDESTPRYRHLLRSMGLWYLQMVGRVAQRLLDLIGDQEEEGISDTNGRADRPRGTSSRPKQD